VSVRRVANPSTLPKPTPLNFRVPHSRRRRGCAFRCGVVATNLSRYQRRANGFCPFTRAAATQFDTSELAP
jgi:hypothetical protein